MCVCLQRGMKIAQGSEAWKVECKLSLTCTLPDLLAAALADPAVPPCSAEACWSLVGPVMSLSLLQPQSIALLIDQKFLSV